MVSVLKHRYKNIAEFCKECNPDSQHKYIGNQIAAFKRNTATITDLVLAYGDGAGAAWLIPQLADLSEFCGCKNKLTDAQIKEVAIILATKYHYIKVSEYLLFFSKMKQGLYGNFYGALDPIRITSAFIMFIEDRALALKKLEAEMLEQKRQAQAAEPTMSYEEWKSKHNKQ